MPKAIQDNDRIYNLLSPLVQFGFRCHYNSFTVRGLDNLPAHGSYIIAPCHQQALMEPLAVLTFERRPPVFLARADIFRRKGLRRILTFLKIMPVYRMRDGQDQLGRNAEVFDRCRDVLLDGTPLCLMAEGRHNNRHHLLNMGKGMFRIAAEAQEALGNEPLYIVPTGIDFDDYEQPYSNCVVDIGRPIAVQPFMDEWHDNAPLALNHMRDALFAALLPLMHDIRSDEHYDDIFVLCHAANRALRRREHLANNAWNRFAVRRQVAVRCEQLQHDEARFGRLMADAASLRDACARLGVEVRVVAERWSLAATVAAAVATLAVVAALVLWQPLVLAFVLLCFPLALLPTHRVVRRRVADPQFRSSFNWGVRFFSAVVYTPVMAVVMACTGGMWMSGLADIGAWWGLVALAVAVVAARLTPAVATFLRRLAENIGCHVARLAHPQAFADICRLAAACCATLDDSSLPRQSDKSE